MQIAQRCVLVIVMGFLLCCYLSFLCIDKKEGLSKEWEIMQTDIFLNRLQRNGFCLEEEVMDFGEALSYSGNDFLIKMEEYKMEQDLERNVYYSFVSWEEIKQSLSLNGRYNFSEDSVVLIEVRHPGHITKRKCKRFGRIVGECVNGA